MAGAVQHKPITDVAAVRAELLKGLASIDAVADALGASNKTIGRLIERNRIPTITIARKRYLDLEQMRAALTVGVNDRADA